MSRNDIPATCASCGQPKPFTDQHVCCEIVNGDLIALHGSRLVCLECAVVCLNTHRPWNRVVLMHAPDGVARPGLVHAISDHEVKPHAY